MLTPFYNYSAENPPRFSVSSNPNLGAGWTRSSIAFYANTDPQPGMVPFYNYSADNAPAPLRFLVSNNPAVGQGWTRDSIAFYAHRTLQPGMVPFYSYYADNPPAPLRFRVSSNPDIGQGWTRGSIGNVIEGIGPDHIAFYAMTDLSVPAPTPAPQPPLEGDSALAFDGQGDLLQIPFSDSLQLVDALTLECWVRPDRLSGFNAVVQYPQVANAHTNPFHEYAIYISGNGSLHTRIDGEPAGFSDAGEISIGSWNHVAVVWDGASRRVSYYVNGESVGFGNVGNGSITYDNNNPLLVGANASRGEAFAGQISDLRVWNRVRSAQEIQADMNRQLAGNESGLVGYWPLDDGSGNTARDLVRGNNGALDGPQWANDSPFRQNALSRFAEAQQRSPFTTIGLTELELIGPFGRTVHTLLTETLGLDSVIIRNDTISTTDQGVVIQGRADLFGIANLDVRVEFTSTNQFNLRILLPGDWRFSDTLPSVLGMALLDDLTFSDPFCIISSIPESDSYTRENDPQLPVASVFRENGLNFFVTVDVAENERLNAAHDVLAAVYGINATTDNLVFRATLGSTRADFGRLPNPESRPVVSRILPPPARTFPQTLFFVLAADISGEYQIRGLDGITFTDFGFGLRIGQSDAGRPELGTFTSCSATVNLPSAEGLQFTGFANFTTDLRSAAISGFLRMEGEWVNPLGIRRVIIGDDPERPAPTDGQPRGSSPRVSGIELGVARNAETGQFLPIFGVIGRLRIDLPDAEDLDMIGGLRFNGQNLFESLLWAEHEELPMIRLASTGLGILNGNVAFAGELARSSNELRDLLSRATLRDIYLYVVPQTLRFLGRTFTRGVYFRGTADLYGFQARVNLSLDETGGLSYHGVTDALTVPLPGNPNFLRIEGSANFADIDVFDELEVAGEGPDGPEIRLVIPPPFALTLPAHLSEFISAGSTITRVDSAIGTVNDSPVRNRIQRSAFPGVVPISGYISARVSLFDITQDILIGLNYGELWFILAGNVDAFDYNLTYISSNPVPFVPAPAVPTFLQDFYIAGSVSFDIDETVGPLSFGGITVVPQLRIDTRLNTALTVERQLPFFRTTLSASFEFNGFSFEIPNFEIETPRELRDIQAQTIRRLLASASDLFEDYARKLPIEDLGRFFREGYRRTAEQAADILEDAGRTAEDVGRVLQLGYSLGPQRAANILRVHYDAGDVAQVLTDVYDQGRDAVESILGVAGFTGEEIGDAVEDVFGDIGDRVGDIGDRINPF